MTCGQNMMSRSQQFMGRDIDFCFIWLMSSTVSQANRLLSFILSYFLYRIKSKFLTAYRLCFGVAKILALSVSQILSNSSLGQKTLLVVQLLKEWYCFMTFLSLSKVGMYCMTRLQSQAISLWRLQKMGLRLTERLTLFFSKDRWQAGFFLILPWMVFLYQQGQSPQCSFQEFIKAPISIVSGFVRMLSIVLTTSLFVEDLFLPTDRVIISLDYRFTLLFLCFFKFYLTLVFLSCDLLVNFSSKLKFLLLISQSRSQKSLTTRLPQVGLVSLLRALQKTVALVVLREGLEG